MTTSKITGSEVQELKISSLPSRPTAPASFGGRGFTARDMKAAFDRLPMLIVERFNQLLDDIEAVGEGSFADAIATGIAQGHTLSTLFEDIGNGNFSGYLTVHGEALNVLLSKMKIHILAAEAALSTVNLSYPYLFIDCGSPADRAATDYVEATGGIL